MGFLPVILFIQCVDQTSGSAMLARLPLGVEEVVHVLPSRLRYVLLYNSVEERCSSTATLGYNRCATPLHVGVNT
jgi:hypothetical protein